MSFAAAVNPIIKLEAAERNFSMESQRGGGDWPLSRKDIYGEQDYKRWLHSDIKNVALPYVFNTYDKMLTLGGFTE